MKYHRAVSLPVAALLLATTSGAALSQASNDDHDAHHPEVAQQDPATEPDPPEAAEGDVSGIMQLMQNVDPDRIRELQRVMEDVDPERIREMHRMMVGHKPKALHRMHERMHQRPGRMTGPRMRGRMMGPQSDSQQVLPGPLYGLGDALPEPLTSEQVEEMLEEWLARHGNPHLTWGTAEETDLGEIVVDLETVDGSLVQRLAIDRHTGQTRQVREVRE